MIKICIVTAARSEYGYLKWLIKDLSHSNNFEVQLLVTGGHLLNEQGSTINEIISDGLEITSVIDCNLDVSTKGNIAKSMGRLAVKFSEAFDKLTPDYLLVLGDRYELLPICNTAFIMRIPIIHISGGDVTTGAIDNGVRNAITMLADYHFPGPKSSANNIVRMRGDISNIWAVGELGLDAFHREKLLTRKEIAAFFNLNEDMHWGLMTYHPETTQSLDYNLNAVKACLEEIKHLKDYQFIVTYANADFGGNLINKILEDSSSDNLVVVPSLGHFRYLSFMKQVDFIIGNSSSGIVEAPFLKIPVINVGNRQNGRYLCDNIIQSSTCISEIHSSVKKAIDLDPSSFKDCDYWGDGFSTEKIVNILEREIVGKKYEH